LRISWLIVGMKPFTFRCRIRGGYFAQQKKRGAEAAPLYSTEDRPPGDAHVEQCSALARWTSV
jgi:hypothetical protein